MIALPSPFRKLADGPGARLDRSLFLRSLASLRLTLALLVVLAVAILLAYQSEEWRSWSLALPLAALSGNLLAAVATNGVFRRQLPLLIFHLALVALLLLVAAGRLTYLKGTLELTEGATFEGQLTTADAAPFHFGDLAGVRFANEGFAIDYAPGLKRGPTRNQVGWVDDSGRRRTEIIGDQQPLKQKGYRFYTSFNKGFAPLFLWQPAGGPPQLGTVHLPAYPLHELTQAREWTPPGSAVPVWVMLQLDEQVLDPDAPTAFRLPEKYRLVVRAGDNRVELLPGQSIDLPGGRLDFQGLKTWMGYTVFYDWTLPWLAAACVVAVLSLGWHFWRKFAARPWDA